MKVTVQTTGTYDISAYGGGSAFNPGGKGAEAGGTFTLTQGETLEIVAGGAGNLAANMAAARGSFVLGNGKVYILPLAVFSRFARDR